MGSSTSWLFILAAVWIVVAAQTSTPSSDVEADESTVTEETTTEASTPPVSLSAKDQKVEVPLLYEPTSTRAEEKNVPVYSLEVNGITCILLQLDGVLSIKYKSTRPGEMEEKDKYTPDEAATSGECNDDSAILNLMWEDYVFSWYFSKTPGGDRWYVSKLELKFILSPDKFPGTDKPGKAIQLSTSKERTMYFPTPVGKSYFCPEDKDVRLSYSGPEYASISLRDFRVQPFIFKNKDFGPGHKCSPEKQFRDETAPIAVGSTLAIVVLLTVTGYGVYRYFKIKKVQYDTME